MKVVIVGGGFGGIKTALRLSKDGRFKIQLISDRQNFEYHAALYRSATGRSPREVVIPLKDIFDDDPSVEIVQDEITSLDAKRKIVRGATGNTYRYDKVVFALGDQLTYFGIKGMDKGVFSLDTIKNTISLREQLKKVANDPDPASRSFIVIGGGASGVELAAELQDYIRDLTERKAYVQDVQVTLIEAAPRVLSGLSLDVSHYAHKRLIKRGVDVRVSTKVKEKRGNKVLTDNGELTANTIIWTAGAQNHEFFFREKEFQLSPRGRVEVDVQLQALRGVYVLGDNAQTKYHGMAQTALHDGLFVAENLIREMDGEQPIAYVPKRPIYAIPVGGSYAVIQWGRVVFKGRLAWWLRRMADFRLFAQFEPLARAVKTFAKGEMHARTK